MAENFEQPIMLDPSETVEKFRARVHRLESGIIVTVPVNEGSRGPLYTDELTSTSHGKLRTTTRHYHLSFDILLSKGLEYAGQCVEKEVEHFIKYMKSKGRRAAHKSKKK